MKSNFASHSLIRRRPVSFGAMASAEPVRGGLKHRQEAEKKIKSILTKCKKIGLKNKDIAEIYAANCRLQKQPFSFKFKTSCVLVVLFALAVICGYLYYNLAEDDQCWINMPQMVTKAARPPEPCSMCSEVFSVKRMHNITPEEFENKYAYNAVPIVVTDATTRWTALKEFDFWFFKKVYTESDLGRAARDCQFFPYKTEFESLHDALQMDEERANLSKGSKPWYIGWSNCHDSVARLLRQHYGRPYFLPDSAENNAVDWIFMGGPGDGAQMHVDNVVHPSWQAQLRGKKRWQLAPPPECLYSCISMEVTVHPGEIIVLDTNRWYHKTEVLPGDLSITIGAEYD